MPTTTDDWTFEGECVLEGVDALPGTPVGNTQIKDGDPLARSSLRQDARQVYEIPLTEFRVHNALETLLPFSAAADDFGFPAAVFGTATNVLKTRAMNSQSDTIYARTLFQLPSEYDDGETAIIRLRAGMETNLSDFEANVDTTCFKTNRQGGLATADLTTALPKSANSFSVQNYDFPLTTAALVSGDLLDLRISYQINDLAGIGPVLGVVYSVQFLLDIKG